MSYRIPQHCSHKPISITNNHPKTHNLDIRSYSYEELLNIFGLPNLPNLADLKTAKKKMLMIHPDKSNLPPDYFTFYKKAYEIIVNQVRNQLGQAPIQNEYSHSNHTETATPVYTPVYHTDEQTTQQIRSQVASMKKKDFNSHFNQMYDEHAGVVFDERRNAWFTMENGGGNVLHYNGKVNGGNMVDAFSAMKKQQQQHALVQYRGVRELQSSSGVAVGNYHENVRRKGATNMEDSDEEDVDDVYISSDPFSKLKFDDLRKVHKDQTIFNIGEDDYRANEYTQEQYKAMRSTVIDPMDKSAANAYLETQQNEYFNKMARRQHRSEMQIRQNEEINRQVMSQFLQIGMQPNTRTSNR